MKRALAERAKQTVGRTTAAAPVGDDAASKNSDGVGKDVVVIAAGVVATTTDNDGGGSNYENAAAASSSTSPAPAASASAGVGVGASPSSPPAETTTPTMMSGSSPESASAAAPPPSKIPRLSSSATAGSSVREAAATAAASGASAAPSSAQPQQQPEEGAATAAAATTNAAPAGGSRKRQRQQQSRRPSAPPSSSSSKDFGGGGGGMNGVSLTDVPDDTSAFYLKHQNRALVVEWQSLQQKATRLERERDRRRRDSYQAALALRELEATWTRLEETVVGSERPPRQSAADASSSSLPPPFPSTGSGDSVEWTRAVTDALAALASTTAEDGDKAKTEPDNDDGDDRVNVDASADDWSSKCAANIASRAGILQEQLLRLVSGASVKGDTSGSESAPHLGGLRKEVEEAKSKCLLLQKQVEELALSRDAAVNAERQVRRNVYRLQAGMIPSTDQLVKALESVVDGTPAAENDEDFEFKRELRKQQHQIQVLQQQQQAMGDAATRPDVGAVSSGGPGTDRTDGGDGHDRAHPQRHQSESLLQKSVTELKSSIKNRDASIQVVRFLFVFSIYCAPHFWFFPFPNISLPSIYFIVLGSSISN